MLQIKELASILKNRSFIFQGSEIYDGLANTFDYGPLGVELKRNLKQLWWKEFIHRDSNMVGLDSSILLNPRVWEASGHLDNFNDPLIDCKSCKTRYRADKLIEESIDNLDINLEELTNKQLSDFIKDNNIKCTNCGKMDFTDVREFNLMFKTQQGVVEGSTNDIYLRPETAQGIFINFKQIQRSMRKKLPFGIGQIGKSFRNEITPGNFIFRTREFEQMEIEFFCKPEDAEYWYKHMQDKCVNFVKKLGIKEEYIRLREHDKEELSHYSDSTCDIEVKFPFGWGELWGIANRTDFDLSRHSEYSNEKLIYQDPITNEKFYPYCIEPSVGVERLLLSILLSTMEIEDLGQGDTRNVLRLIPELAPYKVAVFPLSKKLSDKALEVFNDLTIDFVADYDEIGAIGKRYRRHDEIGTPLCITIDFDTLDDNCVTVRDRDTMNQDRISISELKSYINSKLNV